MSMNTVWIDMSDMLVWKGTFTGIQRVTYEYARRFEKDGSRFCAYDPIKERFFEISLEYIKSKQQSEGAVAGERVSARSKMRKVIGAPYYALPTSLKKSLRPLVAKANHVVRYAMSETIDKKHGKPSPYDDFPTADFSSNDTVMMIGAGWNDPRSFEQLIQLKQSIGFKIVQHLNDILPIYQPQLFADELPKLFEPYVQQVIHNADAITVISEATKRDVEIYCKENSVGAMKVEVVRLGDDVNATKPTKPAGVKEGERFIFALGTFEVRKNYTLLYQALKLAQLEERDLPKIIIAGRKGWLSGDTIHLVQHDPYTKEKLMWLDNVSDGELSWLFDNCLFTVFPSVAEGWGLPVVESLHHGKFCLASGVSSMLEIGEGLIDYFLPYDARECMEKMQYYLAEDRYMKANQKVAKQYKAYTWDSSYTRLQEVLSTLD